MRNHCIGNDSQLRLFTFYGIGFRSGSEIYPIQCEQCSRKSNWFQKQPSLESKESDNEITFQQRADLQNSPFTLGPERSTKGMRYGTHHF